MERTCPRGGNGDFNPAGLSVQASDIVSACAEIETGGDLIRKAPENRLGESITLAELADPEGNGLMISEYVSYPDCGDGRSAPPR